MAVEARPPADKGWLYHPDFPDHWERCTLYSLAKWVNGLAFRDIQFTPTGMPVIKIAEIKGGISSQTKFTQQTFDESVRVRPGDLLFSWSGQPETSIDAFWWRGPEGWLNQHVFRVTPADGIDPAFFYYLLRYLKPNFVGIARNKQTTGLGHVTKRDLDNIEAAYPELPQQRAIAHILGTLDDKIELNRRMSETLEAMARALFKSWFVDFDPVRAKAEGRDPGLPKHIADLFPDSFQESELGWIPSTWKVGCLGDHINTERGLSYGGAGLRTDGSGLPMHNLNSIYEGGGYKHPGIKFYAGDYRDKHIVLPGDMIIANTEQGFDHLLIGHAAIVPACYGQRGLYSHHIFRIRPKPGSPFTQHYLVRLFNHPRWHQLISGFSNGTTINMLPPDALRLPKVLVPPTALIARYTSLIQEINARIEAGRAESLLLASQRDALLPKLVSGKLRVRDAVTVVERTL